MKSEKTYKKTRLFKSLIKEKIWLEDMAQKGYLLTDIRNGIHYTFDISEPKHMIYEVDRFYLPESPSLKDILQMDEFTSSAVQKGWSVITHDKDMNYYFAKEYVEGDINELYYDKEMRLVRANKYKNYFESKLKNYDKLGAIFGFISLFLGIFLDDFILIGLIYVTCILVININKKYLIDTIFHELQLSTEEWKYMYLKDKNTLLVKKRFFFSKGLSQYLNKQSKKGWRLVSIASSKYLFKKIESKKIKYVVDTKASVNRRMKNKRDILRQGNDWQIQSIKDAKEKDIDFICASENNIVIYANFNGERVLGYSKNTCINSKQLIYYTIYLCGVYFVYASIFFIAFCIFYSFI